MGQGSNCRKNLKKEKKKRKIKGKNEARQILK